MNIAMSIFDRNHSNIVESTFFESNISDQVLIFVNLYQHAKNQFIPSAHSSDPVNSRVPSPD